MIALLMSSAIHEAVEHSLSGKVENPDSSSARATLLERRDELEARMARIKANVRRSLDSDSEERAKQLEDREVVDALGNETRRELAQIRAAIERIDDGKYGVCLECGGQIAEARLAAQPDTSTCIDCAALDEHIEKFRSP